MSNYLGPSVGSEGITPFVKQGLEGHIKTLKSENDTLCSVATDEMALDEKNIYDKNVDKVFGYVTLENTLNEENDGK